MSCLLTYFVGGLTMVNGVNMYKQAYEDTSGPCLGTLP